MSIGATGKRPREEKETFSSVHIQYLLECAKETIWPVVIAYLGPKYSIDLAWHISLYTTFVLACGMSPTLGVGNGIGGNGERFGAFAQVTDEQFAGADEYNELARDATFFVWFALRFDDACFSHSSIMHASYGDDMERNQIEMFSIWFDFKCSQMTDVKAQSSNEGVIARYESWKFDDLYDGSSKEKITKGAYGEIYTVQRKSAGHILIAKFVNAPAKYALYPEVIREVAILERVRAGADMHHLIQLARGADDKTPHVFNTPHNKIVMVYPKHDGDVAWWLNTYREQLASKDEGKDSALSPFRQYLFIIGCVASALDYLHTFDDPFPIAHRDVKPENVLVSLYQSDTFLVQNAVLSDFGMARYVDPAEHSTFEYEQQMLTRFGPLDKLEHYPKKFATGRYSPRRIDLFSFHHMILEDMGSIKTAFTRFMKKDHRPGYTKMAAMLEEYEEKVFGLIAGNAKQTVASDIKQAVYAMQSYIGHLKP